MTPIRCPKCGRLLGYFDGQGSVQCSKCRKGMVIVFDTKTGKIEIERQERH